ncbi:MAG: hypothetical protein M0P39_07530 [Rhodocyclaceae bacterium]|nr:hypothetical protein [Rhodocyclaceae bacterium]
MDDKTTYQIQRWTAWTGPVMVVTYLFFWVILGHNFPPPSPGYSGAELVANYYVPHRDNILLGMCFSAWLGLLYVCWSVQLTCQMWRREKVPVLSLMQLAGGILTGWLLGMCAALWVWCARYAGTPNIDPELIKAVHTFSWYIYDMTWTVTAIQCVACGAFAILDKKQPAIFPAWVGWLAIATAATFIPLTFLPYFDDGPFALNGWWSFHVVFGIWGVWFTSYTYYMFQDLKRIRISPMAGVGQAISN